MPRFVVLEHDHPRLHWDFLLEVGTVLRGWRLASPLVPGVRFEAEASFDHRLAYLEYEGPVSGNRGRVTCWDRGSFTWEPCAAGLIAARLDGGRLQGRLLLEPMGGDAWIAVLETADTGTR